MKPPISVTGRSAACLNQQRAWPPHPTPAAGSNRLHSVACCQGCGELADGPALRKVSGSCTINWTSNQRFQRIVSFGCHMLVAAFDGPALAWHALITVSLRRRIA